MERKIKHLEMIQGIINRMSNNSFLLKGWSVTLVAALFVLSSKENDGSYIIIAFFPVIIFWFLDGYYLWQERLFRDLYDNVRIQNESNIDFYMDTKIFNKGKSTWLRSVFFSIPNTIFYLTLIVAMVIVCTLKTN